MLIPEPSPRSRATAVSLRAQSTGEAPAPRGELPSASERADTCLHCGTSLPRAAPGAFCCSGCEVVYGLLHRMELGRYYDLQGSDGQPVAEVRGAHDLKWLEPIEERLASARGLTRIDLDIQGIHCTGCVWLIEQLFKKRPDGVRALVNPALGKVQLAIGPRFPLRAYLEEVERFGYLLGPSLKREQPASSGLLVRMGICIAIAMNAMTFAISLYAGLDAGPLYRLFNQLNLGLSLVSVVVGGSVFFSSAWQGLKRGLLHLDTPIALGILLAFGSSAYSFATKGGGSSTYFDTLDVFIALMLVGRWLQERVLERNRRQLLESDGVDGLYTRRVRAGRVSVVRCTEIVPGDALLVAPGDLVPVSATPEEDEGSFSFDWINGESQPRAFRRGDVVPAGAFAASQRAATVRAAEAFSASPLVELLRSPVHREADAARATPWWQRLARVYVAFVLVAAAAGFAGWTLLAHDVGRAVDVVTAVLVVTCPCAFGIATPMAYELVQAGLRRAGLFVRAPGFLDRASSVRRVVFDKTGTLTTGTLVVLDAAPLAGLAARDRAALYNLCARSTHPKSVAVKRALEAGAAGDGASFDAELEVVEHAGLGVELVAGGAAYRFGAPGWAAPGARVDGDVALGRDGELVASITTGEELRPDARDEVSGLRADGYDVWMLSGDAAARVAAVAAATGIPAERALAERGAEQKAEWIRAHDRADTLMVGDGINDSLVVSAAHCSGTPAIDRPFMAARSDFYFVTPGLGPIRLALDAARALSRVVRKNLAIAVTYNAVTVALAYTGRMSPLLCAILMPLSSLTVLAVTAMSLSKRSALWKR